MKLIKMNYTNNNTIHNRSLIQLKQINSIGRQTNKQTNKAFNM